MSVRIWSIGLLGVSLGLTGCKACFQQGPPADVSTPDRSKAKGKSKASKAPVPLKDTITAMVFHTDERDVIWMESRSGTIKVNAELSFWTETGFILPEGSGYRHNFSNATTYFTTVAPGAGATKLSEILTRETEPPAGYAMQVQTSGGGRQRISITSSTGQSTRLGMFKAAPSTMVWLEAKLPTPTADVVAKAQASDFQAREGGGFMHAIPAAATALTGTPLVGEELAPWKADLEAIRGPGQQIFLAERINLDGDEAEEAFLCVPAGMSNGCFVGDMVGEERRYYPVSIDYAGGAERPLFYQTDKGRYVMYSPAPEASKPAGPLWVVHADGGNYATDTFR
jgi:hypothetical protein